MLRARALLVGLAIVSSGCAAASARERELPPLVNPATTVPPRPPDASVVTASQPALPVGIDASNIDGLCGGWCDREAFVATTHPTLGLGRFEWLHSPISGAVGPVFIVDGRVRWSLHVGDTTAHVLRSALDSLGHAFFQLELGDGTQQVVVIVPTDDGFTDLHTLESVGPWRAASASFSDGDDVDGRFEVRIDAGYGPIRYRWDGSGYVAA